jgi:hypothetical protein
MREHRFKVFCVDRVKRTSGLELAPYLREHVVNQSAPFHRIQPAARGFRTLGVQAMYRQRAEWTNGLIFYHRRPARNPFGAAADLHRRHVIIFYALNPARTMNQIAVNRVIRRPKLSNRYIRYEWTGGEFPRIVIAVVPWMT